MDAHIALQKEKTAGLIQITRAYFTNAKGDDKVLTRSEYTIIEPTEPPQSIEGEIPPDGSTCSNTVPAIVVEGPGRRGELVQVCTNPECEVHGKPNYRVDQDAVRQREDEWQREQEARERDREDNGRLRDAVLERVPKKLNRADYKMLVLAAISRLDCEDLEATCSRYKIGTDEISEPDAVHFELQARASKATDAQLIRILVEFALLPSGYSDEPLEPTDPLASAASRYGVSPVANENRKRKRTKCTSEANGKGSRSKKTREAKVICQNLAKKRGAA